MALLCVAALGGGYYVGRYLLGEEYLKKHASEVRTPQPISVAPRQQAPASTPTADTGASVVISPVTVPPKPPSLEPEEETVEEETDSAPAPLERLTIQLGSFADKANAEILVQDLKRHGVPASSQAVQQDGRSLHKVRAGTYNSREKAEATAEEFRRRGYNALIVPKE